MYITYEEQYRSLSSNSDVPALKFSHGEADTRLLLHSKDAADDGDQTVIISSRDTEVAVIALGVIKHINLQLGIIMGSGNNTRLLT